ncbi:unnamed protein product [Lupinus luteus]|uniref:Pectinesterase inhibitor domain-containing protein n=1 Tax=Lupinus luteus TaxID=3873 RepID=A0AAV1XT84_LUPLU
MATSSILPLFLVLLVSFGIEAGIELPGSIPPYIINLIGRTTAFDTYTLLNTLIHDATDPQLKQRYITCSSDYISTLEYFDSAKNAYISADYKRMKSNTSDVIKAVRDCDRRLPNDTSQLPVLNKRMQDVSSIIIILADFLSGP